MNGDTATLYQIQKYASGLAHECLTISMIIENAKESPDDVTVRIQGSFCHPFEKPKWFPLKRVSHLKAHDILEKHEKAFRNMPGVWSLYTQ